MNNQIKYYIEDITYRNGVTRTDGRYPNRIGSMITLESDVVVGEPLYFRYVKYNNGTLVEDHITRTSRIEDFEYQKNYLLIFTHNSIYSFKELEESL